MLALARHSRRYNLQSSCRKHVPAHKFRHGIWTRCQDNLQQTTVSSPFFYFYWRKRNDLFTLVFFNLTSSFIRSICAVLDSIANKHTRYAMRSTWEGASRTRALTTVFVGSIFTIGVSITRQRPADTSSSGTALFIKWKTWSDFNVRQTGPSLYLKREWMTTGIVTSALMVLHNTLAYAIQTSGIRIRCLALSRRCAFLSKAHSFIESRLILSQAYSFPFFVRKGKEKYII